MIAILAATLGLLALLLYAEWTSRRDRRTAAAELERSRAETAAVRAQLVEEREQAAAEREAAARERRELYQRIQAPETAVIEHVRRERGPYKRRKPIGADDDAAFAERNDRG